MTRLFLVALLAFGLSAPGFAQHTDVRVHTVAAVQQDAPVRVVRLVLWPDHPQPLNPNILGVVLENISAKTVVSVELLSETTAPPGCAVHPRLFGTGSGPDAASVYLEPGTSTQHWTGVASPTWIISRSLWLKSRYLHVQVGIARVDFSDGSSWRSEREAIDLGLLHADIPKCSDWQWPEQLDASIGKWNDPQSRRLQSIGRIHLFVPPNAANGLPADKKRGSSDEDDGETSSYFYDCNLDLHADEATCGPPRFLEEPKQPRP